MDPVGHLDPDTLAAYVDGRLAELELGQADRHIDSCASCRVELSALAATSSQPRSAGPDGSIPESGSIGRYHVLREIGRGAMGIVLRAYDPELARPVALKLLRNASGGPLAQSERELLRREARALAKLRHPNVVNVYDVFSDGESFYVAMELVEGDTLKAFAKRRSPRDVLAACVAAGRGLAAAHDAGIVHRDFKPENVLCTQNGDVRVSDFGLAREVDEEDRAFAGTPAYMAPEVLARKAATAESDQYSFCVTVYELLEGVRPTRDSKRTDAAPDDESRSPLASMADSRPAEPVVAGEWTTPSSMPAWVWRVLRRGLATEPRSRWPSMHALSEALADDPAIRRKRRLRLSAGALAAIGVGALTMRFIPSHSTSCATDDSALKDAWNANRQATVERAMTAASDADNAQRVVAALNQHTSRWLEARRAACSQRASEQLTSPMLACLERSRRELDELTKMLTAADHAIASRALEAVGKLRDPASCRGAEDGPGFATAATDVAAGEEQRVMLDRAAALQYLGRLDEAEGLAHAVAWTASDPRLIAEGKLIEGRIENERARPEKAEPVLFEALQAAQQGHDNSLAAASWIEIVVATGAQAHRFELALSNMRAADAALAGIVAGQSLQLRYDYAVGTLLLAHGKLDDARTRLQAGLAHAAMDRQYRALVGLLDVALCDVERQAQKAKLAHEYCDGGIAILEEVLGKDHDRLGPSLNIVGALAFQEGDMVGAERAFNRAIAIFEKHDLQDHIGYALAQSNVGAAYASHTDIENARLHFEKALALFDKYHPGHPQRLFPLSGLASIAVRMNDYGEAIRYYEQARDGMLATYTADSEQVMVAEYNVAFAYSSAKRDSEADALLTKLVEKALVPGKENRMIAARALDLQASLKERTKDLAASLKLRQRAMELRATGASPPERALALRNLGMTYIKMHKFRDALAACEQALPIQQALPEDKYDLGRIRFCIALSLESAHGDHARAIALTTQANDDFEKAQAGEGLKFYRDATARFLRAAAKD